MNENELLDEIFGDDKKWKNGKYMVVWCDLCRTASIICPVCNINDCSGGGCPECMKDRDEWNKVKTKVHNYLTDEEIKIWEKGLKIKELIMESICNDETEINFKKLQAEGNFSAHDEKIFYKELI